MKKILGLCLLALFFMAACSNKPETALQNETIINPNAPIAFFGKSNLDDETRLEFAKAIQKSGLYNFTTAESASTEQIQNAVEIRLNYAEEHGKFNKAPTLTLKTELFNNGALWLTFNIKEESEKIVYTPRSRTSEKTYRKNVLIERFLEELKRVKSENNIEANKG